MATPAPAANRSESAEARSRTRILLVDDDERNLLALSHVLRDIAEVVTAVSGKEALRQLLNGDFAVILLDVFMPGMDGYEVAGLIRQREQTARIPIIFLSAVNKETEHLIRGYSMGAVDYVFKPVDPIVLQSKVSVFVDLYDMRQQIEAQGRAERELREANFRAELQHLQTQAELQASRARQAAILEMMPLALFEARTDQSGELVRHFVGGNLARIVGEDARAIEHGEISWEERIDPEDHPVLGLPAGVPIPRTLAREYRWRGTDGIVRHFIEQCVLEGDPGPGRRWAGALIDVTERKQLEAQLLQAGKMDAIGKLTGGVAHDFNNLLAVILGGLDLMDRRNVFGADNQPIVEHMRQAIEKGADLVRRMLAFARKQDLKPISITPGSICESIAGLVQQALGGAVRLEWDCLETSRNFLADRSQLELAVINLIINARDAMPDGGKIRIRLAEAEPSAIAEAALPARDYLSISVTDEGAGIPADLINKIAEPFFTTKEVGKGTGLGLSMVMGFVQQSGGKLLISSEEGQGARFEILLPSTEQAAPVAAEPDGQEDLRTVSSILLVDDEEPVRTVLGAQLRDMGVRVIEAGSGTEALAILEASTDQIDLILTDLAMPQINGLQTIKEARKRQPNIRALIMTGYADEHLDAIGETIDVLHKPVSIADLKKVLV